MSNSFNTITRYEPSRSKLIPTNDSLSLYVKPNGEFGIRATGTPAKIVSPYVGIGIILGMGGGYWLYSTLKDKGISKNVWAKLNK